MKRVGSLSRFKSTGSLVRRLESLDEQTSSTSLDTDDLVARLRSLAVAASFDKPSRMVRVRRRAVAFFAAIGVVGWVGITGAAASVGLAATGNLPAPIQNAVSNVLDVVGIEVPRSEPETPKSPEDSPIIDDSPVDVSTPIGVDDPAVGVGDESVDEEADDSRVSPDRAVPLSDEPFAPFDSLPEAPGRSGTVPVQGKNPPGRSGTTPPQVDDPSDDGADEFVPPGQDKKDDSPESPVGPGNSGGAGNSGSSNAGGNSGNSSNSGSSGSSNAGGNSGNSSNSGSSGSSNTGGNSGGAGSSGSSNAGGNSSGSNAGGNGNGTRRP